MQQLGGSGQGRDVTPARRRRRGSAASSCASPERRSATVVGQLQSVLAPFILRRLKEKVLGELTPKVEVIRRLSLVATQRAQYDAVIATAQSQRIAAASEGSSRAGTSAASAIGNTFSMLRKVANHPLLARSQFTAAKIAGLAPIFRDSQWFGEGPGATSAKIAEHLMQLSDFEIDQNIRECIDEVRLMCVEAAFIYSTMMYDDLMMLPAVLFACLQAGLDRTHACGGGAPPLVCSLPSFVALCACFPATRSHSTTVTFCANLLHTI